MYKIYIYSIYTSVTASNKTVTLSFTDEACDPSCADVLTFDTYEDARSAFNSFTTCHATGDYEVDNDPSFGTVYYIDYQCAELGYIEDTDYPGNDTDAYDFFETIATSKPLDANLIDIIED